MIVFSRTVSIQPGRNGNVLAFAKDVVSHYQSVADVEIQLMTPIGGNPNRITFVSRHASLGALEQVQEKMAKDSKLQQMIAGNADNVIPGSVVDSLWKSV